MEQERIADYLLSLEPEGDGLLNELRDYAGTHDVPILRPETESFLRTLMAAKKPGRVLEIGTAIGYSAILMAKAMEKPDIVTIESWEKRIPLAEENLKRAGYEGAVRLIQGDAGGVLKDLIREEEGPSGGRGYDLVFLDAAKGQYIHWLPDILRLMNPGALLVADNVMQDFTVMESRFTIPRRERTTHSRMREFLWEIKHRKDLVSSVLPLGDGVSISVKA